MSRIFREFFCGHFPWKLKDENLRKISPKFRRIFRRSLRKISQELRSGGLRTQIFSPPPKKFPADTLPAPSAPPPPLSPWRIFNKKTDPYHPLSGASDPLPLARAEKIKNIRNVHQDGFRNTRFLRQGECFRLFLTCFLAPFRSFLHV